MLENVLEIETSGERHEKNVKVRETRERVRNEVDECTCSLPLASRRKHRTFYNRETKGERERARRMEGKRVRYRVCLKKEEEEVWLWWCIEKKTRSMPCSITLDDRTLHADGELGRPINRRMEATVVAIYT